MNQRIEIVTVGLRQLQLGSEQIAIGINHIEVRCIADTVARRNAST